MNRRLLRPLPGSLLTRRAVCVAAGAALVAPACRPREAEARRPRAPRANLYACEGCEAIFERRHEDLPQETSIADGAERGERLRLEGVVLAADGKGPAANVVIYAHHTDANGLYSRGTPETEWSRRHGKLRAWVKTGRDGRYAFDTIKPAPYPDRTMPAHIHLTVLEAGRRPYWIDDVVFDGEFAVTPDYRQKQELRGGDGIVRLTRRDGILIARRDIVLEPHDDRH